MYRIEVKPGEEAVFRTIEELATGIRNGFVTSRARIYHAASQKWLPIEFHPHYKKALEGNFAPATPAPQPSLASMPAPTFSFPGASPPGQGPAGGQAPAADPVPEAAPPPELRVRAPAPVAPAKPTPPPATATTVAESPVLAMQATLSRPPKSEPEPDVGPVERYSPVALREAPRPARAAAPAPAPTPEIVLPNITYPEIPAAEHTEHRAPARRSRRTAGRPLLLVGSAAVLVFAGQRFLASRAAARSEPAPVAESVAAEPAPTESPRPATRASAAPSTRQPAAPAAPAPVRAAPARPAPVASEPLVPAPSRPMTPGPAFAASVPSRVTPGSPLPGSAPVTAGSTPAPRPAPRPDSAAIAPAPTAIELDVPTTLPGESIAPSLDNGRDSLAIKRILKAVTGRKANPTTP
jgi:hypothetical protein